MIIRTAKLAALAIGLTAVAGSAQARGGSPATTVLQQATAEGAGAKTAEKQYCVRTTISGSRMPQKVCRTRKAWMAQGFDPAASGN